MGKREKMEKKKKWVDDSRIGEEKTKNERKRVKDKETMKKTERKTEIRRKTL